MILGLNEKPAPVALRPGLTKEVFLDPSSFAAYAAEELIRLGWVSGEDGIIDAVQSIGNDCRALLKLKLPKDMKPGFFYLAGVQSFEKNLDEAESFRGDSNMVGRDTDLFLDPQDQDDDYEGYTEDEKNGQFAKPTVMLALYRDDDALDEEGVDDTDPCAHFRNTPLIEKYRRGDEPLMDEKLAGAQAEFNIEANQGFELGYSDNAFFTWKAKLDRLLNSPLVLKLGWAFTGLRFCGPEVGVFDSWYGQLDLDYWDGNPDPGVGSSLSVWEKA